MHFVVLLKNFSANRRTLLTAVCVWTFMYSSFGQLQNQPVIRLDTIKIKGDRFLLWHDSAQYFAKDTILVLPANADYIIRKNPMEKTNEFYDSIASKMSRTKLARMVYDLVFARQNPKIPLDQNLSEQRFMPFENEIIDQIAYKKLAVFGTNINDTLKYNPNWLERQFNEFHVNTQTIVVRKNLNFKAGDRINPEDLVNSERLLRRLDYIKDARIHVDQDELGNNTRLIVVSKDVLPYNFQINPNNDNNALFGVSNINLGGIGHELEYNYVKEQEYEAYYRVRNLFGTFVDSELDYSNHFRKSGLGLRLQKPFVTQKTKYGGGAEYSEFEFGENYFEPTSELINEFTYKKLRRDVWFGRAFQSNVKLNVVGLTQNTNIVVSGRIDYQDLYDRPITRIDTNYIYQDRTNFLIGIGLNNRNYYKDNFIFNFGRTEDIPTGSALGVTLGLQKREFEDRFYSGFNYARGGYIQGLGYINGVASLGAFFTNNGIHDGTFKFGGDYFSRLYNVNRLRLRHFGSVSYTQSIKPSDDIFLISQRDIGVRGTSSSYLKATNRLNISYEPFFFTPYDFLGFRTAIFGFVDFTIINNHINPYFDNETYFGYGGGLKFRNDNLAISNIQLRFGFYPNLPANSQANMIEISTSGKFRIRDFDLGAPDIVRFK